MSFDPQAQGEKVDICGLSSNEKRKSSIFEGSNAPGATMPPARSGESGAACSKDDFKTPLKIEIPKNNPPINPKYSSETPIVLNKLPIFEENESN